MVSINVLVITYNQEDVISRALDSVLIQKDYGLNQIIISDDCSTDNTWSVLEKYKENYPDLITTHRNNPNLGIYGNLNNLVTIRGNADLYYFLSGDDALCDGFFASVQALAVNQNIDVKGRNVALYFDWKIVRPDNKSLIVRNNRIAKGADPFRLRYRLLIYNRSSFVSRGVIEQFKPVPLDRGVNFAEDLFEFQTQQYSSESYYYPFVGSIYFSQLGVSTKMKTRKHLEESIFKWQTFPKMFNLNEKDTAYSNMKLCLAQYALNPSFSLLCDTLSYAIKGIDVKLGIDYKQVYFFLRSIFKSSFGINR